MINSKKAVMIGCGFVGSASVFALMQSGLFTELVLIDANKNKAEGEAMDISHGIPFASPMKIYVAQFSFGFYSLMLTSLLLGVIVMVLYKPRTWCAFCPMGTMTQGICKLKNNGK